MYGSYHTNVCLLLFHFVCCHNYCKAFLLFLMLLWLLLLVLHVTLFSRNESNLKVLYTKIVENCSRTFLRESNKLISAVTLADVGFNALSSKTENFLFYFNLMKRFTQDKADIQFTI